MTSHWAGPFVVSRRSEDGNFYHVRHFLAVAPTDKEYGPIFAARLVAFNNERVKPEELVKQQLQDGYEIVGTVLAHKVLESGRLQFLIRWGNGVEAWQSSEWLTKVTKVKEYCADRGLPAPGTERLRKERAATVAVDLRAQIPRRRAAEAVTAGGSGAAAGPGLPAAGALSVGSAGAAAGAVASAASASVGARGRDTAFVRGGEAPVQVSAGGATATPSGLAAGKRTRGVAFGSAAAQEPAGGPPAARSRGDAHGSGVAGRPARGASHGARGARGAPAASRRARRAHR